jgi:hypothetical protein
MFNHAISTMSMVRSSGNNRELILQLARKDVIGHGEGSLSGLP